MGVSKKSKNSNEIETVGGHTWSYSGAIPSLGDHIMLRIRIMAPTCKVPHLGSVGDDSVQGLLQSRFILFPLKPILT